MLRINANLERRSLDLCEFRVLFATLFYSLSNFLFFFAGRINLSCLDP